jgi:hippurate hydrolase
MPVKDALRPWLDELIAIRRDLHANPELGFEETRTAAIVAERLKAFGVDEVHTGIAGTGVVGVVRGGGGTNRAVGLRADMDALPIAEKSGVAHLSRNPGRMHACGHDGHTTMLLGAARYLAGSRDFDGTVYLIFQPAEEGLGGGRRMVEEGLFERFPAAEVYGLHNMPGLPLGEISMCTGPCMAAADLVEIDIRGIGGHAAMPHIARDPVLAASHMVTALQSIVSRRTDPLESAVVSITTFNAGDTFNVIPEEVRLTGTARSFLPQIRDMLEEEIGRIVAHVAAAFDMKAELGFRRNYPATVNTADETGLAAEAAARVVGADKVDPEGAPKMGAEDFSFMLNERPGAYIWLGNGMPGETGGHMVHTPQYDFNDDAIAYGVSYWAELVETVLPKSA